MLTKADISKFYEDVKKLGLRSPVAEIARSTGMSKGPVSEYLSGKKVPSEAFLKKFYDSFAGMLQKSPRETGGLEKGEEAKRISAAVRVLTASVAQLLAATSGENPEVVRWRLEKAIDEIAANDSASTSSSS